MEQCGLEERVQSTTNFIGLCAEGTPLSSPATTSAPSQSIIAHYKVCALCVSLYSAIPLAWSDGKGVLFVGYGLANSVG